ncbi:MAG TPA: hypothetical protein VFR39_09080 [Burkholderiales bacterium]|nr:hypothetical protein [Burkholderiales bacterium]
MGFLERGVRRFKRERFRENRRRFHQGKLALHGWMYRIHDGEILQFDPPTGKFLPWP